MSNKKADVQEGRLQWIIWTYTQAALTVQCRLKLHCIDWSVHAVYPLQCSWSVRGTLNSIPHGQCTLQLHCLVCSVHYATLQVHSTSAWEMTFFHPKIITRQILFEMKTSQHSSTSRNVHFAVLTWTYVDAVITKKQTKTQTNKDKHINFLLCGW